MVALDTPPGFNLAILISQLLIQVVISAHIQVNRMTTVCADQIGNDQSQAWLNTLLRFLREFFAVDHPQEVPLDLSGF